MLIPWRVSYRQGSFCVFVGGKTHSEIPVVRRKKTIDRSMNNHQVLVISHRLISLWF